jgi:hypothetical protein
MLTARRHRYLTRWPRRLAFALVILLLLAASWRAYHIGNHATYQHPSRLAKQYSLASLT